MTVKELPMNIVNKSTGVIHRNINFNTVGTVTLCRVDSYINGFIRTNKAITCKLCIRSLRKRHIEYGSTIHGSTIQGFVARGLEALFSRMAAIQNENKAAFRRLAADCRYRHRFRRGALYGCKKIKTPSLHRCSIENCPYLSIFT